MRRLILAVAILVPTPVLAAPSDFQSCDGYGPPNKKADGITTSTWLYGLATSANDFRRRQSVFGRAGIEACERALADPLLQPRFWVRRAHMLQAKAMHLLVEKDFETAIATLAESDAVAIGGGDSLVTDSVGLGNRALRSMALMNLARRPEAETELNALRQARPFAAAVRRMARSIRLSGSPKIDTFIAALKADAFLEPNLLKSLFWVNLSYAHFQEAVDLYPEISFDVPRGKGEYNIQGFADKKYTEISDRADFAGGLFYALSALGRAAEALKIMENAHAEISQVTAPPPPPAKGQRMRTSVQVDYQKRLAAGAEAREALSKWESASKIRATASESSLQNLLQAIKDKHLAGMPMIVDLLAQVQTPGPGEAELLTALVEEIQTRLERKLQAGLRLDLQEMAGILPRPESATNKARFRSALPELLLETSGVTVKRSDAPGEISISYRTVVGTDIMTDELGLLAAAMQAKKAGKDSFLVQSRMSVVRTLSTCYYGSCSGAIPNGYESRISIQPVDSTSWPGSRKWRLINAQQVYDQLSPKYLAPPLKSGGD